MEAIKPRQIINYDAGIVLIDLHQLNVKTTSDNTNQRHWIRGNLIPLKNRTHQQPATSAFLTKWLNKLIPLLMCVQEFLSLGHWSLPSETQRQKREHIHQLKVMKNEHPAFFLRTGRYCNSLNYEGIAVIELQFYHFPDSDRLRVGSVTD